MAGKEKGNLRSGAREEGGNVQPVMLASWQFACLLIIYRKMHRCSVKKNWCALFERQFQSIILVTKVLKFRTFLFELYVLISIASVQTPLSLQKKRNNLGEAWTLQFFLGEGASVHWLSLGTLRCHDGDDNENVKKAIGWRGKTTTLYVHHAFLYISLPSLHDYDGKMPNFTFYGGRKQTTAKVSFSF